MLIDLTLFFMLIFSLEGNLESESTDEGGFLYVDCMLLENSYGRQTF
jgi:hypothetical protein